MNKRYLLFLLITFVSLSTQAQDQKFHFGLKISPTLAYLKPDTKGLERDGAKLGFTHGIMTEFNFQQNYAIATGVQVTYRGGKLKFTDELGVQHSSTLNLQYVEIPITLKLKTNEFGNFRYFGQFGFVNGLNIRARDGDDNNIKSDAIHPYNLAMTIAIGTEYKIAGTTALMASFEFNNGFIDVVKGEDKVNTNYFALNVGVLF